MGLLTEQLEIAALHGKGALWIFGVVTPSPQEDDRLADD